MTQPSATAKLPRAIKAAVLIVATAFLIYCIYWLIQGFIWGYTVTYMLLHVNQIGPLHAAGVGELAALFVQEYCSVANSFVLMFCGAFAFQSTIQYVRGNEKYLVALRRALVLLAVFSLLLVPASVHHFLGVVYGWFMVDIGVGLSYAVQAVLITPTLLMLAQKMRFPQNPKTIKNWACIAASAYVFALYFKYLLLWQDTLVPMGPKEASAAYLVGAANSLVTLLVAGVVTAAGCYGIMKMRPWDRKVVALAVILVGLFFVVFSFVALFVPIYASFWYLTDFWMVVLPVLGVAILFAFRKSR